MASGRNRDPPDDASVGPAARSIAPRPVAERLAATGPPFPVRRKLMDGGTCEATVYAECGFDATGLGIPVGNYHAMDRARGRLAPEYIDLARWRASSGGLWH